MDLIRQLLSVIGVILLAGSAGWWLRRRGLAVPTRRRRRHLETLERLALTPHHSLLLVRIRDRAVVIGLSPSACSVLETLEWRVEVRCED